LPRFKRGHKVATAAPATNVPWERLKRHFLRRHGNDILVGNGGSDLLDGGAATISSGFGDGRWQSSRTSLLDRAVAATIYLLACIGALISHGTIRT